MKTSIIIASGGGGLRFGSVIPKQYLELDEVPIIVRAIRCFESLDSLHSIIIACSTEWRDHLSILINRYNLHLNITLVESGVERQESIANALKSDSIFESDVVMVHDAVRPFVAKETIDLLIREAEEHGACIPVLSVKESIKEVSDDGFVVRTIPRRNVVTVQTPQAFRRELLQSAYARASQQELRTFTDDSSLVERMGVEVKTIKGDEHNLKITSPNDFELALLFLAKRHSQLS